MVEVRQLWDSQIVQVQQPIQLIGRIQLKNVDFSNHVLMRSQIEGRSRVYAQRPLIWAQIAQQEPRQAQAWAHLGLMRAMEERYLDAITAYNQAIEIDPTIRGLHMNLGLALFKQTEFHEAIPPLKDAAKESPEDPRPRLLLAMIHYGLSQYADAIPYFQQAVADSPANLHLRMLFAESCLRAKQYACTLEQYGEILRLQPESPEAYMLAGEAFDGLGENASAIEQFQQAAKLAPHQANVHFGLGYLYWEKEQLAQAQQEFESELANDPTHAQALAYLGDIAVKGKQDTLARSYLERAVAVRGASRLAYLDLGILNAGAGNNEAAVANFEQAIRMKPNEVDAHWRLARLFQSMGKKEQSQIELAKVRQIHEAQDNGLADQIPSPALQH